MNNRRILISQETFDRLKKFGIIGSNFDSILNELMDHTDVCDLWWNREQ